MSIKEYENGPYKISQSRGHFVRCGAEPHTWRQCEYKTPDGYVTIYMQREAHGGEHWRFSAIVDGYEHTLAQDRNIKSPLTERGAKIIAGRWIRSLVERES